MSLVSICIPAYNAVKYIQETIECFLNQTYPNIEIIVQDDYSTDGTWELLKELYSFNKKIKLYQNQKNLGIGLNWNAAYDKVQGEYVVIANADDIFSPNFIKKGLENLKDFNVDFVSFKYERKFEFRSYKIINKLDPKSRIIEQAFNEIFFNNPFSIVFTIFKKANLDKIKLNKQLFMNTQVCDYELLLRYSEINKLYYDNSLIGYYRIHNTNNSSIPLAELKSYFFDVLPLWHTKLLYKFKKRYLINNRKRLFDYVKSTIRLRTPFDINLILKMIRHSF